MRAKINENWLLTNSKFIQQREYWVNKLTGDMPRTTLFFNTGRSRLSQNIKDRIGIFISPDLGKKVMKLSKESDISIYIILLTGLKVLLHRYTENEDITVASPVFKPGISKETLNDYLLIRDTICGDMTFKEAIIRIRQSVLEAYQNQDYPFAKLLEFMAKADKIPVDHSNSFIECVLKNIYNDRTVHDIDNVDETLVFSFLRSEDKLYGEILYDPGIYETFYTEQLSTHFIKILEHAVEDINLRIHKIPMLSEAEKKRLIVDFNNTKSGAHPEDKTIPGLFADQVERTPDNIAAIDKHRSFTYRELNERANQEAYLLQIKGIRADSIVGIMAKCSFEIIVDIFAVLKAGGAYLPITPDYPEERKQYILGDSEAKILLSGGDLFAGGKKPGIKDCPGVKIVNSQTPPLTRNPLAYIIYTSGSTGKPKGVMVEHWNLSDYIHTFIDMFKIDSRDIVLQQSLLSFDISVEEIYPTLLTGGRIIITPKEDLAGRHFLGKKIQREQVTVISVTPLLLNEINKIARIMLRSLRLVISGGDVLKAGFIDNIVEDKILYNGYGPTEATVAAIFYRCSGRYEGNISIGKPIANTGIYILTGDNGLLPLNVPGELCIVGKGIARGYLNRPELTAEKFVPDPFLKGERMYRTGDLARRLPDGNIQFLGRIDQQVKIWGYRIELGEIERRLLEQKNIKDAVVIAKENKEEKYICAYIVSDSKIIESEIREDLVGKLPQHFIPTYFVQLEKIPLTPNGKIDTRKLPGHEFTLKKKYTAPRDEVEVKLVEIWADVLEIGKERIGVDSNFFELGGHSLKVTILAAKIHKEFNVRISLPDLFKIPFIRELGEYIRKQGVEDGGYEEIEPVEKKECYPLSSAQNRLYLLQQMDTDNTNYNMTLIISLDPSIDKEKLAGTFKKLITRHESLRTSFDMIAGEAVQIIHQEVLFAIEYYEQAAAFDRTGGSSPVTPLPLTIAEHIKDFIQPFNLAKAPLLRARLIRTGEKQDLLLLDMHHIITDGTSNDILNQEFRMLSVGEELEPLKLQYKDYARYQQALQETDTIKRQEAYWLKEFAGDLPVLNMPTDYSRPLTRNFAGNKASFNIGEELTKTLRQIAKSHNATLYMVLLTVYYILLAKLSVQGDIIVGTFTAGRRHTNLDGVIGMFVNTLPLRNFPENEKTFLTFLTEVKERTLAAFENQDYPLEYLVSKIPVARDMDRSPLFDVVFDMHLADPKPDEESAEINNKEVKKQYPEQMNFGYEYGTSKFDIIFVAIEIHQEIQLVMEYSTRLYKQETITKFFEYYEEIIKYIAGNINIKIKDIAVGGKEENYSPTANDRDDRDVNIEFDI